MINPIFKECTTCGSLEELVKYIDCTIAEMAKNRYYSVIYNIVLPFDSRKFKKLLRYKRILQRRLTISNYPDYRFNVQDLIFNIKRLVLLEDCSQCATCFPTLTTTTTTP